jgi:DNA-binding transcriptional MerR regulator
MDNRHTVKQLSDLAGVSVRTLHYYDEIGLLKPSTVGENGYRYYTDDSLFRLQQILFFREMELSLLRIKEIVDEPTFDRVAALQAHRLTLQHKIDRLKTLIRTVDATISHLQGATDMSKKKIFEGFSEAKQKEYQKEAIQNWGEKVVKDSVRLWKSYGKERQKEIMAEGGANYEALIEEMDKGPDSAEVQAILARWHQHLRYFYEPTLPLLRGLGNMYHDHPGFNATFTAMHPDLPAFLQKAINNYVDDLELKEIERELALLEA